MSHEDLLTIGRLQLEHFQRIRNTIAKSPPETSALLNMQLIEWLPVVRPGAKLPRTVHPSLPK